MTDFADTHPENRTPKKIVVLSSHVFLPGFRKASVHFVSQSWASMGHEVCFITIGHSWLTRVKDARRFQALKAFQNNRLQLIQTNLEAGAYLPFVHAFSTGNTVANAILRPFFGLYAAGLPSFARDRIAKADLIVLESGTALAFFDSVHKLNPAAGTLYFCRDLLKSIGAAPFLQEAERRLARVFDSVCVPSKRLGDMLPTSGNVNVIEQGIDTGLFDSAVKSPYPPGSRNAVTVGDMLFDQAAVAQMAAAAPHVDFHLFGIHWQGDSPANIRNYGERAFEAIVPYIRHADIGLAPYRMSENEVYLAESSLKLLQYAYCRLPLLLPDIIPARRGNEVTYALDRDNDWAAKIETALALPRRAAFADGIMTWREIAAATLRTLEARG